VMKKCGKCQREIDLAEFGSQAYCRPCWRAYDAARRRVTRPILRAARKDRRETAKRRETLKYAIATYPESEHLADWQRELESL
jgi:hypothetical protein